MSSPTSTLPFNIVKISEINPSQTDFELIFEITEIITKFKGITVCRIVDETGIVDACFDKFPDKLEKGGVYSVNHLKCGLIDGHPRVETNSNSTISKEGHVFEYKDKSHDVSKQTFNTTTQVPSNNPKNPQNVSVIIPNVPFPQVGPTKIEHKVQEVKESKKKREINKVQEKKETKEESELVPVSREEYLKELSILRPGQKRFDKKSGYENEKEEKVVNKNRENEEKFEGNIKYVEKEERNMETNKKYVPKNEEKFKETVQDNKAKTSVIKYKEKEVEQETHTKNKHNQNKDNHNRQNNNRNYEDKFDERQRQQDKNTKRDNNKNTNTYEQDQNKKHYGSEGNKKTTRDPNEKKESTSHVHYKEKTEEKKREEQREEQRNNKNNKNKNKKNEGEKQKNSNKQDTTKEQTTEIKKEKQTQVPSKHENKEQSIVPSSEQKNVEENLQNNNRVEKVKENSNATESIVENKYQIGEEITTKEEEQKVEEEENFTELKNLEQFVGQNVDVKIKVHRNEKTKKLLVADKTGSVRFLEENLHVEEKSSYSIKNLEVCKDEEGIFLKETEKTEIQSIDEAIQFSRKLLFIKEVSSPENETSTQ